MAVQEALLESYRSTQQICLDRWRYRQWVAEVAAAASKEGDDAGVELLGDTDDEEEDIVEAVPRDHGHEASASTGDSCSEED